MRRALPVLFGCVVAAFAQDKYDLVVYGGTAGGVMTAVSGAREGLRVVLLEPGSHLGGMATGGLSRTDFGKKEVIGGDALEFYWRVGRKYDIGRFAQDVAWFTNPGSESRCCARCSMKPRFASFSSTGSVRRP